jgi:hypothetical protein
MRTKVSFSQRCSELATKAPGHEDVFVAQQKPDSMPALSWFLLREVSQLEQSLSGFGEKGKIGQSVYQDSNGIILTTSAACFVQCMTQIKKYVLIND